MADRNRQFSEVPRGMARVSNIVAIASGKGGVGKSTVSTNFAMALKKAGHKVGLLDADIYGPSQPGMLGWEKKKPEVRGDFLIPLERYGMSFMSIGVLMEEDTPVIWRAPMATKMIQQFLGNVLWGELDYLIVDLPPGTGDVQITLAQQAHLTGAIIVTTPQQVALGVAKKGMQMFNTVKVPILGIIENMSGFTCEHCGKVTEIFKTGGGEDLAEVNNVNFLGRIPLDPEIVQSGEDGVPILERTRDSQAAKAFSELAQNFHKLMEAGGVAGEEEPQRIELSRKNNLVLTWPDGKEVELGAYDLRINCPCAICVSEDTGEKLLDPKSIPLDIKVGGYERIGRYAVALQFSDGHSTGIFKFEKLRQMEEKLMRSDQQKFNV